jgi:hypothetical protein
VKEILMRCDESKRKVWFFETERHERNQRERHEFFYE